MLDGFREELHRARRAGALVLLVLGGAALLGCGDAAERVTAEPAHEGVQLTPGMWKFTTASMVPGMKAPKARTTSKCIRPDRTDPVEHLSAEQKCEVTERDEDGQRVRWKMTCPTIGHAWQATGEITSHGSSAVGQMDMTMQTRDREFEMHLDWQGERVGECGA